MKPNSRLTMYLLISGFFLLLDQALKYLARTNSDFSFYLWKNWFGWEYMGNTGVAFSLPMPNIVLLIITPLVLLGVSYFLVSRKKKSNIFIFGGLLFLLGAVSNYIDRVLFSVTIDYLRIVTGVINLADVMIVVGVVVLFLDEYKKKNKN